MLFNRRDFLQAAGVTAGGIALPASALAAPRRELTMGVFKQQVRASGPPTEVWGFDGSVPGPVLRYARGDKVDLHVINRLPQVSTVHWHGLRVPNRMDGVPYVTQAPIEIGGRTWLLASRGATEVAMAMSSAKPARVTPRVKPTCSVVAATRMSPDARGTR